MGRRMSRLTIVIHICCLIKESLIFFLKKKFLKIKKQSFKFFTQIRLFLKSS